ncbi:hypothetical protein IW262DRAFT_138146 [Armillaria fumosa]|nr:hypothetical protein IW262DRAFT_138146 [Armillaria fumosa]
MQPPGLPPELCDAIIDELREDKKSLLQISLTCRALCPRTRVHLFHAVTLSGKSCCDRLRALITLSPKLALHFKSLRIDWRIRNWNRNRYHPEDYEPLTVIESLVGITDLYLALNDWGRVPDAVASSLQSCSYRSFGVGGNCNFTSMGEICSLLQNSPDLEQVSFTCKNTPPMLCDLDHSLHGTPAPSTLCIMDYQDTSVSAERPSLLKLPISSHPCPFSFCNIRTLTVCLYGPSTMFLEDLRKYLALPSTYLKHFCVIHGFRPEWSHRRSPLTSLDVSDIESVEIRVSQERSVFLGPGTSDILQWWISNFSSMNKRSVIRSLTFTNFTKISFQTKEGRSSFHQEDLWMRLDDCLTSYKMGSLECLAITFNQ